MVLLVHFILRCATSCLLCLCPLSFRLDRSERLLKHRESLECGLDDIVGIPRPVTFREDILYTCDLDHRPHRTAGNNPGSFVGRLYENLARSIDPDGLVRNGTPVDGDLYNILLGTLNRLSD